MANSGFSFVPEKGFTSFRHDLGEGVWKDVVLKKYDVPDQLPSHPLLDAPRTVVWKLRAFWAIGEVESVLGSTGSDAVLRLDVEWDSGQRALHFTLGAAAEHGDLDHREAAQRLRAALLSGNGTEQTKLGYDEEVDYGRHQIEVCSKGQLADDVKTVGIAEALKRVSLATDALAAGIGRAPGQNRAPTRSKRLREALGGCSTAFNAIYDELGWLVEHTPHGAHREHLETLRAPFTALLERYPGKAASGGKEAAADAAPEKPAADG